MWLLPLLGTLVTTTPTPGVSLPQAIRTTLDQEYPGWKLAPVSPLIQREFNKRHIRRLPSLSMGDFNHDGKMDYVVQIALTTPGQEEQIIIIFMAGENGYEENIVESLGLDPSTYLWVKNISIAEPGPNAQDKMINKDVLMVLGNISGDTVYSYQNGKFEEITLQQDEDHPDSSIPRPPTPL